MTKAHLCPPEPLLLATEYAPILHDRSTPIMHRVGQNHIYTVYIRCFWQGNHQIYGHIRCIYTVLANPIFVPSNSALTGQLQTHMPGSRRLGRKMKSIWKRNVSYITRLGGGMKWRFPKILEKTLLCWVEVLVQPHSL